MGSERESALLWLPGAFLLEVAAWELDTRLGLGLSDPTWEEFGRSIQVERIAWGLAAAIVVLAALFLIVSRQRSTLQVSLVQLLGVLALAAYWVGASVFASGAAVTLCTLASWMLSTRRRAA